MERGGGKGFKGGGRLADARRIATTHLAAALAPPPARAAHLPPEILARISSGRQASTANRHLVANFGEAVPLGETRHMWVARAARGAAARGYVEGSRKGAHERWPGVWGVQHGAACGTCG